MSRRRRHSRSSALLDFFACFLIPAYTLLFAGGAEWFGTNFSVRAVLGADYFRGFVIWGFLAGGYFFAMLTRLILTLPEVWLRRGLHILILSACVSLGYAIVIPYLPEHIPSWAKLHVCLAAGSCILLMTALLVLLLRLRYHSLLLVWLAITVCSGVLFFTAGMVTTALEVFFTISASLLIRRMWLTRHNEINQQPPA